ncbi:hypothetical protein EV182_003132 [Spiromyces aspiralis]|uniref:Uncharacterized protein n=1 Tax=Spiromyces aspiralis TaxID=68401 RepID=A0ACC1HDG0_9FUNG|nr:hypothetical protein EV182_003132 [Spiromyces aspiralis]
MCGNGIKEGDEECDCGTGDECDNDPCCDSKTCKLKNGAKCSDFNDLCCSNCQMRSKGTVCRPKVSECDVEETCDGVSGDCPSDKHVENGEPCSGSGNSTASTKNSNLRCASGQCTNRDLQCEARGASIGATKHCSLSWNTDPCNFQCQSPDSGLACMYMSGSFIDGTECGWHAKCANGKCKGDNAFYQFVNLYRNNMPIAIPVTIIVVVILFALVSGILNFFCGCCRVCAFGRLRRRGGGGGGIIGGRKSRRMQRLQSDIPLGVYPPAPAPQQQPVQSHPHMPVAVQDQQPLYGAPGAHGYPPPPPYNSNNAMPASWVDPTPYNGPHQQPYHNH